MKISNKIRLATVLALIGAGNLLFVNLGSPDGSRNGRASSNRPRPNAGSLIQVANGAARGWALDTENPAATVSVSLELDGVVVGEAAANAPDQMVTEAFGSNNAHGFTVSIPGNAFSGSHRLDLFVRNGDRRQLVSRSTLVNGVLANETIGQL